MTWISICPDQSQLEQKMIPVVIAFKSSSARLVTWPQFGQTWTLSQFPPVFSRPELVAIIDPCPGHSRFVARLRNVST
jgi:hypothetical protein